MMAFLKMSFQCNAKRQNPNHLTERISLQSSNQAWCSGNYQLKKRDRNSNSSIVSNYLAVVTTTKTWCSQINKYIFKINFLKKNFKNWRTQHLIKRACQRLSRITKKDLHQRISSCSNLRPHELKHARFPCPSLFPGVGSDSCPLNQWCCLTISSSVALFFYLHLSQKQGLCQWVSSLHQMAKVLEL